MNNSSGGVAAHSYLVYLLIQREKEKEKEKERKGKGDGDEGKEPYSLYRISGS